MRRTAETDRMRMQPDYVCATVGRACVALVSKPKNAEGHQSHLHTAQCRDAAHSTAGSWLVRRGRKPSQRIAALSLSLGWL